MTMEGRQRNSRITASATPRALVTLTGILGLRPQGPGDPPSCTLGEDGTAIWRLNHGIVVTCAGLDAGGGHWHIDRDDPPAEAEQVPRQSKPERTSVWHLLDGVGQMVSASSVENRLELTVGRAPGYTAEEPDYTVMLGRGEAAALGRALLDWSEAEQVPSQSYSERAGVTDEVLARRCAEFGVRVNRVEMDVLVAAHDGHDSIEATMAATGLSRGQVVHALGVLRTQGMVEQVSHESIAGHRAPLTSDERSAMPSGQGWLNLLAPHDSPVDLVACPSAGARGLIYVEQEIHAGDGFTPDEARQLAQSLLQLADHAEYGPGEWHNGVWTPERRDA